MKLSKSQIEALQIMAGGYEAGYSWNFHRRAWLQKGKIGHGGESKKITISTFNALRDKGLLSEVDRDSGYSTKAFKINNAGKAALKLNAK